MGRLPGAMFVVDVKREHIAVAEARKLGIPVVAVVDTNCDPDLVDYVVPGNDDAIRSIRIFLSAAADACLEGTRSYEASLQQSKAAKPDEPPVEPGKPRESDGGGSGPKVEVVRAPGATEAPKEVKDTTPAPA